MLNGTKTDFPPYVLDVEASGFGSDSYPIEVGVITATQKRYCSLIHPAPSWIHWDDQAEALHGISRAMLSRCGRPPSQVCEDLNALLHGQTVYTDGWVVDYPWMIRLFATARLEMAFSISPLELLLSEFQMENWAKIRRKISKKKSLTRHRASSDAECIQQVFVQTRSEEHNGRTYL